MGNFLPQRGLLIYILAPESCDSYMILYNNYEFCLFVFVCLYQHITCLWRLRLMVTEQPGIYWPWPFRPYNIKGPLPWINKSKNSFIVSSWICWMWWDGDQRGDVKKGNCCGMRWCWWAVLGFRVDAAEWGSDWWVVLGFQVLRAGGVILVIVLEIMWLWF